MEYSDKQIQILETAEQLFSTTGFNGTSVRDIAQKANVNLAMISYYFGSKENLLEAIFDYRSADIQVQLAALQSNTTMEPLQKIEKMIDAYVDRIMSMQCFHRIMMREQMLSNDTTIGKKIHEYKKRNNEFITKLITEGQKKGAFKKKIDMPLMMVTMFGTAHHLISTQHYYREMNNLQDMSDEDFQKLLHKKLSYHLKSLFKAMLTYEL